MSEYIKQYVDLCEKAFLNGSFVPLFRGELGYCIRNNSLPADIPTDWSVMICFGVYDYYRLKKDSRIIDLCREAITELLNGGAFELWCAYNVCFFLLENECKNKAPFRIMDNNMVNRVKTALNAHADLLKKAKIWNGKTLPEGLWTDIVCSARVLKMKFNIDIV